MRYKDLKFLQLMIILICVTGKEAVASLEAFENDKKTKFNCHPIAVEIDYSYLRTGVWVDKEECLIYEAKDAERLDRNNKFWGLMNCEQK